MGLEKKIGWGNWDEGVGAYDKEHMTKGGV